MKYALLFLVSTLVWGYPEMIRYNYVNCTSCHVAPNGGGVLTPYGKVLAGEVVSSWGTETEGQFLWGAVELPNYLNVGGDIRYLQLYTDTANARTARFIFMQADLEAAIGTDKIRFVGTIGKSGNPGPNNEEGGIVSRRHFVQYNPAEGFAVRFGKFYKTFGINTPEHTLVTKKGLGWDQDTETYNLEGAYLGEQWDLFVTGVLGRIDTNSVSREKGVALRGGYNLSESQKVGLSYFYGSGKTGDRHVFGPYAQVGFSKNLFLLAEVDFQRNLPTGRDATFGWVNYLKFGYEVMKGMQLFANHEISRLDLRTDRFDVHLYGLGVQWWPRPHFEIQAMYQKQKVRAVHPDYGDIAWLLLHYYL